jgi:hypothetical protein
MEVGLEDVLHLGPIRSGLINVGLHFTQGVENGHLTIALQIVGSMGDAPGVYLLDLHGSLSFQFGAA